MMTRRCHVCFIWIISLYCIIHVFMDMSMVYGFEVQRWHINDTHISQLDSVDHYSPTSDWVNTASRWGEMNDSRVMWWLWMIPKNKMISSYSVSSKNETIFSNCLDDLRECRNVRQFGIVWFDIMHCTMLHPSHIDTGSPGDGSGVPSPGPSCVVG
jgi:hypothetical protein